MIQRIKEIEREIKKKTDEMDEYTLKYSIEVGKLLCEAKGMLKHGEWMNWASHNLPFGIRTAGNLMKVYREYKDIDPESAILKLNYCVANELTKIACDVREETAKEILENGGNFRSAKIIVTQKREKTSDKEETIKEILEKERKVKRLKGEIANLYHKLAEMTLRED